MVRLSGRHCELPGQPLLPQSEGNHFLSSKQRFRPLSISKTGNKTKPWTVDKGSHWLTKGPGDRFRLPHSLGRPGPPRPRTPGGRGVSREHISTERVWPYSPAADVLRDRVSLRAVAPVPGRLWSGEPSSGLPLWAGDIHSQGFPGTEGPLKTEPMSFPRCISVVSVIMARMPVLILAR